MKMIFKAFTKKLFGVKYERLIRTVFICLILFWGLHTAGFQIGIAPSILYLTVSVFTAGVMWQALSSEDNAADMQNMVMLPFEEREFVFAYIAAMGIYTFLTKTMVLLAVLLALSVWNRAEVLGSILCAVNAVLMTAAVFALKSYRHAGTLFCLQETKSKSNVRGCRHHSVWIYFFRYLKSHKNYFLNTVIMWCAACVLPLMFRQMEDISVIPIGFAILSLNTPVCILLSCDRDLEQAVRFLPGQKKTFCIPYCLFIFLCNITADVIFLCSWQIRMGGVTFQTILTAVFFAMQSALFSVLLEWFYPVRGWKIESDLQHHPRKYIVPAVMLLLAGAVGAMPMIISALIVLLAVEITVLLIHCQRC